jgi:hypothetical protein|tara:strand:- start:149 stop:760 length:612 start_codon:yes stop_codon:yes gene_type:complete
MNIKSTVRVVKTKSSSETDIHRLISGSNEIAWTEELDPYIPLTGDKYDLGFNQYRTIPLQSITKNYQQFINLPEQTNISPETVTNKTVGAKATNTRELRNAYLSLTSNSASLVKQYFPEAMQQPIQGLQFIVATYGAVDAWTMKDRSNNIQASMATGKAIIEAIDVFAPFFPSLKQIQPISTIAGVALKTAESAYLVYTTHQK